MIPYVGLVAKNDGTIFIGKPVLFRNVQGDNRCDFKGIRSKRLMRIKSPPFEISEKRHLSVLSLRSGKGTGRARQP